MTMDINNEDGNTNATNGEGFVGIEVDGRVFYCSRSTLTSGSAGGSYFARRFGGLIPPGAMRLDEYGRSVYSIDRNAELFEKHILEYLRTNHPGQLPPFSQAPELWRALRREADFFRLDGLSELLHATYTCDPSHGNDRGVLYWLGTEKGKKEEYRNPHGTRAIHVGGAVDMPYADRVRLAEHWGCSVLEDALTETSRQALVEYRPPVKGFSQDDNNLDDHEALDALHESWVLDCDYAWARIPAVIDLKSISVRLTHYSMRYGSCGGMSDWNLEGSQDGNEWAVLHEARNDQHLRPPQRCPSTKAFCQKMRGRVEGGLGGDQVSEILLSYAETHHRHTWPIDPPNPAFYRFFRLIGTDGDIDYEQVNENSTSCMHPCGIEFYGQVHEA